MRPVIGVTGPDRGGGAAWAMTRLALTAAGARPVRITPGRPVSPARLHGLVLGGGADVDPELYGESQETAGDVLRASKEAVDRKRTSPSTLLLGPVIFLLRRALTAPSSAQGDAGRDRLEYDLIEEAMGQGLPVLGICRGAQILNTWFGGTLHRQIRQFYAETPHMWTVLPRKLVTVAPSSRLAAIIGGGECHVNALHNQAIRDVGDGLEIAAREAGNDIVQAVEARTHPFLVGVQWHPEYLPQHPHQRKLFRALVGAARRRQTLS